MLHEDINERFFVYFIIKGLHHTWGFTIPETVKLKMFNKNTQRHLVFKSAEHKLWDEFLLVSFHSRRMFAFVVFSLETSCRPLTTNDGKISWNESSIFGHCFVNWLWLSIGIIDYHAPAWLPSLSNQFLNQLLLHKTQL